MALLALPWAAAVSPRTTEPPRPGGGGPEPLGLLHVCTEPFAGYAATEYTAVIIGYVPGNVTLYDQYGLTVWSGPLPVGSFGGFLMDTGPLVACADAPFSLLVGASFRIVPGSAGVGGGAFVVDANGSGASRSFYLYTAGALDPGVTHTVIFAYENGTSVVLSESGRPVWSGTLNRGEHHVETGLSNRLLRVESDREVAVLDGVDPEYPEYFAPAETGLFAGTRFLTWVPRVGSPLTSNILQVMGYYDDTRVTVTFPDTGAVAWSGVLDNGTVAELPNHPDEYVEVSSSKPVTVSSLVKGGTSSQMEFVADAAGLRFGKDFLTPTQVGPGSSLGLFSPLPGTRVDLYNATSRALVATVSLGAGEYRFVDPTGLTGNYTRIRSNNPISVLFGLAAGSATYAPVVTPASLPDLSVQAPDILVDSAGPLRVGIPTTINATIRNLGPGPAGAFATRLFEGEPATGTQIGGDAFSLSRLLPSGTFTARVPWTPASAGPQRICVLADAEDYVAETEKANNAACVDAIVAPPVRPDYVPWTPQPDGPIRVGLSRPVSLSLEVRNAGNGTAAAGSTLAFFNESSPAAPFATLAVPPLAPGATSARFAAAWTSPATPGTYRVIAQVDHGDSILEWNETNNEYAWTIDVVPGPTTTLVVGTPNVTASLTYVASSTPLALAARSAAGVDVAYTEVRVDEGSWTRYAAPFTLSGDGMHLLEFRSADVLGNLGPEGTAALAVDDTPPTSELRVGAPSVASEGTWVASSTPLEIAAHEDTVGNGTYVNRTVGLRVFNEPVNDGETFEEYLTRVNLTLSREIWPDLASVTFRISGPCLDTDLGIFLDANGDGIRQVSELLGHSAGPMSDETVTLRNPPAGSYIIAIAGFAELPGGCLVGSEVVQEFRGPAASGLSRALYRVGTSGAWTAWQAYPVVPFALTGNDGPRDIEYRSEDRLGNLEVLRTARVILDDTPPTTAISPRSPPFPAGTRFALNATDAGSGVARTEYRIDGGTWTPYTAPFAVPEGEHAIGYRSVDRLGNAETERTLVVPAEAVIRTEFNWKPFVALAFSLILLGAGAASSRRAPWRGGRGGRAVLQAFGLFALPFLFLEAATGVVSLLTGLLSIPPVLGAGTAVDVGILAAGVSVSVVRVRRRHPAGPSAPVRAERQ